MFLQIMKDFMFVEWPIVWELSLQAGPKLPSTGIPVPTIIGNLVSTGWYSWVFKVQIPLKCYTIQEAYTYTSTVRVSVQY